MRRSAFAALLAVGVVLAADPPFTFVVLGDRTGDAKPEVFRQILAEIVLLNPDYIFGTGDLIQGYTKTAARTQAQWDTIISLLRSTGVPFHLAPGNHDIFDPSSESIYSRRINKPFHSFKVKGSTFLFLDNTRWPVAESLPPAELKWLDAELTAAGKAKHLFVFMHRPYWRYALDAGRPEMLHEKFKAAGAAYVFTGHDHYYCTTQWDLVRYFQVGPSGSRLKVYDRPEAGAFQNYLVGRVSGDTVQFHVREPGRDRPLPVDTVTLQSIRAFTLAQDSAVTTDPLLLGYAGRASADRTVTIRNIVSRILTAKLTWRDSLTAWRVTPKQISVSINPGGHVIQDFRLSVPGPDSVYPLPGFSLPYDFAANKQTVIERSIAIRRSVRIGRAERAPVVDGSLDDPCWKTEATLRGFGDRSGRRAARDPVEVWVARDEGTLYIAGRCADARMDRLMATATDRDGPVSDDDHVSVLLDFDRNPDADSGECYQVSVNPLGAVADRRCWFEKGRSRRDYGWNGAWRSAAKREAGAWTFELACPLADFGKVGTTWGINCSRLQARDKGVSVWQVPFEYDPGSFGVLTQ
jgi:3',5'-cyclic AMP phosphodiesterase CpdA